MQPKWKALAVFVPVFAALVWFTFDSSQSTANVSSNEDEKKAAPVNENLQSAPVFTLKDLEGNQVSLSDYQGKLVFVNFWATWCGPCRMEIPHFVELVDEYGDDGFAILGISVDDPRDFEKIPGFAEKFNINYPVLYANGQVVQMYGGIGSIPTTFVINREGKALGKIVGARSKEEFEGIIKQFL
jgi:cytochrome c biogenesis protein CcmG/thiol:disulfide interchange protein DsbE